MRRPAWGARRNSEFEATWTAQQAHFAIIAGYADALDRRDWTELGGLCTPGAEFVCQHVPMFGAEPLEIVSLSGRESIVCGIAGFIEAVAVTYHFAGNEVVTIGPSGRAATAIA